jgi:hypothetical protein
MLGTYVKHSSKGVVYRLSLEMLWTNFIHMCVCVCVCVCVWIERAIDGFIDWLIDQIGRVKPKM